MGKKQSTISVIIPTYNRAHFIGRAINSVLNQTYQDFEIIVVDDASTDNTERVVKRCNDSRISYFRHWKNIGGSAARNTGIQASCGKYIAFLDSDDLWMSDKLEKQFKLIASSQNKCGLVYTGIQYYDINESSKRNVKPYLRGKIFPHLLRKNVIGTTSSVMIKASCLEETGLFDEHLPSRQDYDFWLRIAKKYLVDFVPEILTVHYIHSDRISSDPWVKIRAHKKLMDKYAGELARNRNAKARQLYALAMLYYKCDETSHARILLCKSLKKWPHPNALRKWIQIIIKESLHNKIR